MVGASENGVRGLTITGPPQSLATTPQVFVSYAWGDTSPNASEEDRQRQEVVVCQTLEKENWKVVYDKNELRPGHLISTFMKTLGHADLVIVVLSAKYLRSPYCGCTHFIKTPSRKSGNSSTGSSRSCSRMHK